MNTNLYCITLREGADDFTVTISGTEAAYEAWRKACDFAEAAGISYCDLWWYDTGEVVASLDNEDDEDEADLEECLEDDFFEDDLEMGFDPYEGDYTWDC